MTASVSTAAAPASAAPPAPPPPAPKCSPGCSAWSWAPRPAGSRSAPQAAFQTRQPLVQSVTTNVPGPRRPLYVLGRPLTELHPYVPIGNTVRLSVAVLSYVGTVFFGVTADYDSTPDLDVFVEGIQCGLAELTEEPSWTG